MTLTEAIERYTSNAEYERIHGSLQGCLDFRQLAEWLKDYERLLEQEPCEDVISREWLKIAIHNFYHGLKHTPTEEDIQAYIDAAPLVTPQPQTGHWELYGEYWKDKFKCSECGKEQPKILCGERIIGHWSDYCPNCGCKMESEE